MTHFFKVYPNVAKVEDAADSGAEGAAVVSYCNPLATQKM